MCGIVGYIGSKEAYPVLIKGLHRLEYRGYDSSGVAMIAENGTLNIYKAKGKVAALLARDEYLEGQMSGSSSLLGSLALADFRIEKTTARSNGMRTTVPSGNSIGRLSPRGTNK